MRPYYSKDGSPDWVALWDHAKNYPGGDVLVHGGLNGTIRYTYQEIKDNYDLLKRLEEIENETT